MHTPRRQEHAATPLKRGLRSRAKSSPWSFVPDQGAVLRKSGRARKPVLRPSSRSVDPSFGRAGEAQFFVPTLRVHVLRSWFRIEDIRARTRSRIRALRDHRGCRDKCPTTKNGTDVRSPSVPIFASRLRVSEANVSMLFLSAPRSTLHRS